MYKSGMTIAEAIADTIARRGITQTEAADDLGVRQSVVSRWASGRDTPKDEYVPRLVKFTGLKQAQVLSAIHTQRTTQASLPRRVSALEAEVAAVRAELAEALELLQGLGRRGT